MKKENPDTRETTAHPNAPKVSSVALNVLRPNAARNSSAPAQNAMPRFPA